jgi:AraC-like DNA-binding protein
MRAVYFERRTMPPQAELAIQQVIRCTYEGPTKDIFLESKCLELLAMFLGSAPAPAVRSATPVKFSATDIEAIKSARDILLSNLIDPPSLEELGALVGMRSTKLKLGFKHVFGRTSFNYLRERRLEFAKDLLAQGKLSIEEVGRATGFPNASHFTQAFQKHYGVLPKTVRGQMLGDQVISRNDK